MKSAIYARISADKTGEQAGVTRQLEDCRNLATTTGWTVVEEFIDNDISASSGKTRPSYRRMLAAIEAGEVDAIVTWAPDRLYRKLADLEPLIVVMEKSGCTLRTVRAGEIDMATPTGRMLARILASVATAEGEVKSDRWRRSIRQRREQGQAPGWGIRLFGYARAGEILDAEAEAIRWAAAEIIDGASLLSVARGLTERGHTSTRGNPWTVQALRKLMSNPRIAGHSTLNGDVIGVGNWEPILSPEVFTQLQSALMIQRGPTGARPRIALLAGLVRCGREDCGEPMVTGRGSKTTTSDRRTRLYKCVKQAGRPGCGGVTVQAEALEEMVEAYAKARLEDPRVRENLALLAHGAGENAAEIIGLEERLRELEKELETPGVPVPAITRAMDRTRERIEELQRAVVPVGAIPLTGDWPADLARRARLVRLVVADVKVGPAIVLGRKTFEYERVEIVAR